jgi:hypothetical protein
VHTKVMRNVTFSAEADLIQRARLRAAGERTTLNAAWLARYVSAGMARSDYFEEMKRLGHVQAMRQFSRDERNER